VVWQELEKYKKLYLAEQECRMNLEIQNTELKVAQFGWHFFYYAKTSF
jgi:hypothetical protein